MHKFTFMLLALVSERHVLPGAGAGSCSIGLLHFLAAWRKNVLHRILVSFGKFSFYVAG